MSTHLHSLNEEFSKSYQLDLIHFSRRSEPHHLFIISFFIFDITILSKSSYPSKFNSLSPMSQFAHDSVTSIILGLFSIIYNSNSSLLSKTLRAFQYRHEILSILLPLFFFPPYLFYNYYLCFHCYHSCCTVVNLEAQV